MTSPRFPKFGSKRKATTKDLNRLIEWVNGVIKFTVRGRGIRFTQGQDGVTITHKEEVLSDVIVNAKTQEAWQTDGTVSCKFLDGDGAEIGDAFDVFILLDKSATDVTSGFWPVISGGLPVVIIKKGSTDGVVDWVLVRPDVNSLDDFPTETITVVTNVDVSGTDLRQTKRTLVKVIDDGTLGSPATIDSGTVCP